MISRAQQILIKRAQREAGLDDADYRDALEQTTGCRSTTDPAMTDRGVDLGLAYMEAIHWRSVDAGALHHSGKPGAVFRQRGYWASKNPRHQTSRDLHTQATIVGEIATLEAALAELGFNVHYCAAIRSRVTKGNTDIHGQYLYRTALRRTLTAKQKRLAPAVAAAAEPSCGKAA